MKALSRPLSTKRSSLDPHDILLEKPRFGAFYGTDLELILRAHGIDTVIISGISTPVCCDTTAREAQARDFRRVGPDALATRPRRPFGGTARCRSVVTGRGSRSEATVHPPTQQAPRCRRGVETAEAVGEDLVPSRNP